MKTKIYMLKVAFWLREIKPLFKTPNDLICCNGDDCGCQGATYKEAFESKYI